MPMFQNHWDEMGMNGGPDTLNLNDEYYAALEAQDMYIGCGFVDRNDKIRAYMSVTLYEHPHHKDTLFGTTCCFYVDPHLRGMGIGKELIQETEDLLRFKYKVSYLQLVVNANFDIGPKVKFWGYKKSDIVYIKKLRE